MDVAAAFVAVSPHGVWHQSSSSWLSGQLSQRHASNVNLVRYRARGASDVRMVSLTRETAQGSVKRVVITGVGLVSCFGTDADEYYDALLRGKSGVRKVSGFDVEGWSTNFAAYIDPKDINTEGYVSAKMSRRLDPFLTYALVSGKKALESAGIGVNTEAFKALDKARCGVLCGSGMGGLNAYTQGVEKLISRGHQKMSPFFVPYSITNMVRCLCPLAHRGTPCCVCSRLLVPRDVT